MKTVIVYLALVVFVVAPALVLTGCGGSSNNTVAPAPSKPKPVPVKLVHTVYLGDQDYKYWHLVQIKMQNRHTLVCVMSEADSDYPLSISCNWEQFNKDSGR